VALPVDRRFRLRAGRERAASDAADALASPSFAERERAERRLVSLGGDARETLAEAARSPDAEVRRRALSALRSIGRALEEPGERLVPEYARLITGALRDPEALRPGSPVVEALFAFPGPAARAAALVAEHAEIDLVLHRRAVSLLVRLGRPEGAPYLAALLRRGWPLPSTLALAARGLSEFAGPGEREDLRFAARSGEAVVRAGALRALARAGTAGDSDLAREALGDADPDVRSAALGLLAAGPREPAAAAARDALEDPCPAVRAAALRVLAGSGSGADRDPVSRLLSDGDDVVRSEAVRAVAALGDPAGAARAGAGDPSPAVRRAAIESARLLPPAGRREALAASEEEGDAFLVALRGKLLEP
jgi:HEAT repeat protein